MNPWRSCCQVVQLSTVKCHHWKIKDVVLLDVNTTLWYWNNVVVSSPNWLDQTQRFNINHKRLLNLQQTTNPLISTFFSLERPMAADNRTLDASNADRYPAAPRGILKSKQRLILTRNGIVSVKATKRPWNQKNTLSSNLNSVSTDKKWPHDEGFRSNASR